MARKLKTFQTSLGFFELAIAAPSMKAALEAWSAASNLFHQGAAKESRDADVVAATKTKPGVVLRRPVGSDGSFSEHAELPKNLGEGGPSTKAAPKSSRSKANRAPVRPVEGADRKAARAYERERQRREREEAKEEAAAEEARTQGAGCREGPGCLRQGRAGTCLLLDDCRSAPDIGPRTNIVNSQLD